jgi:hypothetical protein
MKNETLNLLEAEYGINNVRQIFKQFSMQEIQFFFDNHGDDKQFLNLFYYYLWIFREEETCLKILNHKDFNSERVIQFIYQAFGLWICSERDPDFFFSEIVKYISAEKNVQILLETDLLSLDINLSFHLISCLSIERVEYIFEKSPASMGLSNFVKEIFSEIDIHVIKKILANNIDLYTYFLDGVSKDYLTNHKKKYEEVKEDFSAITLVLQISELIKEKFPVNEIDSINTEKIQILIWYLSGVSNYKNILNLLLTRTGNVTEEEIEITNFALSTPYLKKEILKNLNSKGFLEQPTQSVVLWDKIY